MDFACPGEDQTQHAGRPVEVRIVEAAPSIGEVRLPRQWAGMTPDFSPIMGETPVENYYIDSGWGARGVKATPVVGKPMAELLATGEVPELIRPYRLSRFHEMELAGEKGAASAGH